ncbi:gametogenetin-binding protein 2-like [Watersipora subatra]|uniref:gametogenetin-binding protein 2-like n=1 Tax=Watersipora subatra TaxID=2589382 RepID=UPI00355AF0E5
MAKLVSVVKSGDHTYAKRQMPLVVEDNVTMVLQFSDSCLNCGLGNASQIEVDRFISKYTSLDASERLSATTTNQSEIAEQLASLVPCVGCRKSVERMLDHLALSGNSTLDPMQISSSRAKHCQITLKRNFRDDPKLLFAMFYIYGNKLQEYVGAIPRSKKNKRCQLHSLDTQKTKSTSNWVDLWALLTDECREEVLMIDYQKFMEAMVVYLEKHRFCIECKTKVLHAHGLLIGDDGKKKDKSYCPALYEGINYCKNAKHVHVKNEVEFIANLIARAEPDLMGSRRERHAKTLDIAQEEVLTCLGSYLYVRFNRLLQKIKLEEQTWQQLFYIGICCLKQNFEVALEEKQGISQLELLCSELELEEKNKEHKKEMKRKKKKKSKLSKKNKENSPDNESEECVVGGCNQCSELSHGQMTSPDRCIPCNSLSPNRYPTSTSPVSAKSQTKPTSTTLCSCDRDETSHHSETDSEVSQSPVHVKPMATLLPYNCAVKTSTSDLGYSSGFDGCDSCSASSNDTEPGALLIDPDCDKPTSDEASLDHSCESTTCGCGLSSSASPSTQKSDAGQMSKFHSTLQDMLESCGEKGEETEEYISAADIAAFKANKPKVIKARLALRETLKQRFDDRMQKQRQCCNRVGEECLCDKC